VDVVVVAAVTEQWPLILGVLRQGDEGEGGRHVPHGGHTAHIPVANIAIKRRSTATQRITAV